MNFTNFKLKQLEIINGGTEFKASYEILNAPDDIPYITKHSIQDHRYNNSVPYKLATELEPHIVRMNNHLDTLSCEITKISISEYGDEKDRQLEVKIDYTFIGSSASSAKGTTNNVVMEKDYYSKATKVKNIINKMKNNIFDFAINGIPFPEDQEEVELQGNIIEIS